MIHILDDKWLPNPTTYKVVSPPPQNFDNFPMVSTLIDCDSRRWKVDLVKSLFLPFEARTILNISISYNLPEDKIIWVGNNRGVFTVKSVYYVALNLVELSEEGECSYNDPRELLWRKLWHLHIPSKIKIFAWRACVDALPTIINCKVARRVWDNWEVSSVENW